MTELPGDEWRVVHDLSWPGGPGANIDQVMVGPQGVFVIETLAWSDDLDISGGELCANGKPHAESFDGAVTAAAAVGTLMPSQLQDAVLPVLCIVRGEPVVGWAGAAMVCSTENLSRMLNSRPRRLDEVEIKQAGRVLESAQARGLAHALALAQAQALARTQAEFEVQAPGQAGDQTPTHDETQANLRPGQEPPSASDPHVAPGSSSDFVSDLPQPRRPETGGESGPDVDPLGPPLTRRPTAREWALRHCSRRWARPKGAHAGLRRTVTLLAAALLLTGVLRPDVFETVGGAAAKSLEDLRNPSQTFGEQVDVQGSATRPPLKVVAERPVRTWSNTSRAQAGPGRQLLAVAMTMRNAGDQTWVSYPSSTVLTLRDQSNASFGVNPTVRKTEAGKVMPAVIRIRPGRSVRGYMVFEVPLGTRISAVELKVGPGEPQRVRWSTT